MSFPVSPVNGQIEVTPLGTSYIYDAARTAWIINSQVPTGVTGMQGLTGLAITGATGIIGPQGDTGVLGLQGSTGVAGITGLANFLDQEDYPVLGVEPILLWNETDDALFVGVTGADHWVQISAGSLQGMTGVIGSTGVLGLTGQTGALGLQGSTGVAGVAGNTGLIGPPLSGYMNFSTASDRTASAGIIGQIILSTNTIFTNWDLLTDATSTVVLNVEKASFAAYPNMTSLHGATGIFITAGVKNTGNVSWWGSPTGAAGDVIRASLTSTDGTARAMTLSLNYSQY